LQYYEKVANLASFRAFFDFCQFLKHSFRKGVFNFYWCRVYL